MKNLFRWIISNTPAMNIVMIVVLGVGTYAAMSLQRESFPNFDVETIMVQVPYPGATPEEVENGICQKIEEYLQSIEGVKKMTSTASEGMGMVVLEIQNSVKNVDRTLNEVREAVDRIPSFPELAEDPVVQRAKMQETIFSIGLIGPEGSSVENTLALRELAEDLRQELIQLPRISMVNLVGTKDYQIDVEISENTLRAYGTSLDAIAKTVRAENCQTPGGTIRAPSVEINVRTDNRRYTAEGIEKLPVITDEAGAVLTLEDIGYVRDEFTDGPALATVYTPEKNAESAGEKTVPVGRPSIALGVLRNSTEDLIAMVDTLRAWVKKKQQPGELPEGYTMITWGDRSEEVRSRLELLATNGIQGLTIIFVLLAVFLDLKLAFWVAMGLPFSICLTCLYMYGCGQTLNMISTFGFIMALGIVTDDAIVAGENIFRHHDMGKDWFNASVDGITEVITSITTSLLTTIVAFLPLLFISGIMGKIIYSIPVVMITMLLASMFECVTILPCHLSHRKNIIFTFLYHYLYIFAWVPAVVLKCNKYAMGGLQWFVKRIYAPCLHWVLLNRSIFCAGLISLLIFTFGLVWSGTIPYVFFPKTDGNEVQATVKFPNGTPAEVTDYWTKLMEQKFWEIADEYEKTKEPVAVRSFRVVGTTLQSRGHNMGGSSGGGTGHTGGVQVELISGDKRTVSSMEIADRWRQAVGVIPGADEVEFTSQAFGPPGGAIEFMLVAKAEDYEKLEAAVEEAKKHLATFAGVIDITDSDVPGKWEFQMKIKEHAKSLGIHPQQLAETMRAAYYGAEVERLQRGRHEVKLMVCYPREDRRSLADFDEVRVRGNDGVEYPITEIADIEVKRGYTTISRHSQMRSITVSADVEEGKANAQNITSQLKAGFLPQLMKDYPGVKVRWEGREDMKNESMGSMYVGFVVAMFAMYIILSLEFKSYVQPLLILAIIPFGVIGAVFIHAAFGQPLSQFSLFGMVALSGIVVNDSIVLIDFLNRAIESGEPVHDALMNVGQRRFTSVMLTSVTTVGGLLPLIMETSLQAQMLIPMALTISGGVMSSLILVLFFIPVLYSYYIDGLKLMGINIRRMLIHNDNLEAEPEAAAE